MCYVLITTFSCLQFITIMRIKLIIWNSLTLEKLICIQIHSILRWKKVIMFTWSVSSSSFFLIPFSFHTPSHSFYYMWHIIFLYIKEGSTNQKVIGPSGVKFDPFKQIIKFKPSVKNLIGGKISLKMYSQIFWQKLIIDKTNKYFALII